MEAAARDLDLTETAVCDWVRRAQGGRTKGRTGLTTAEREELVRLRKETGELRTERDILKTAAAFVARHQAWDSPGSPRRPPSSRCSSAAVRCACRRAASTRESSGRRRPGSGATRSFACTSAPRTRRAVAPTVGRASGRTCTRRVSASGRGAWRG